MVLPVMSFLTRHTQPLERRPSFNQIPYSANSKRTNIGYPEFNYRLFWQWFKGSAPLIGIISLLTTDVIGDRPRFVKPNGMSLGRNKELEAFKFWRGNRMKEAMKAILYDMFVTGDGYGWIGRIDSKLIEKEAHDIVNQYSDRIGIKETTRVKMIIKAMQDEDLKKPKKFDYIPSSSVWIDHSMQEIFAYVQNVFGQEVRFTPKEVIHFRLHTVDGLVQGFSPIESLAAEISLLRLIDKNMMAFMENGGSPDKLFSLPEEMANSENHKFLVQTLQRYNAVDTRHGNLVFSGKVDVEDLSGSPKDLEFENLALYLISKIALAFRIPVTRIPFLIGSSATSGDSGGMAESGYWNMISELQDQIEDLLNMFLFEELGYHIQLDRKYKQDEVREAQINSMNADTVGKINDILGREGNGLSEQKLEELLDLRAGDIVKATPMEDQVAMRNQNLMSNMEMNKEPDNRKRADTKRNVVNSNESKTNSV